jgi:plasmid stabilization system protein ParE
VKLIVSRAAVADIERLRVFLEDRNRAAAERAVVILTRAIQSLDNLPERGRRSGKPGIREFDRTIRLIGLCRPLCASR